MMPVEFPVPFSSINHVVEFADAEELKAALLRLTRCHDHNFFVEMGARGDGRIWGSEMAMECIQDAVLQHKQTDPYDRAEEFFETVLSRWFTEHLRTRRRDMPHNIAKDLRRALQSVGADSARQLMSL